MPARKALVSFRIGIGVLAKVFPLELVDRVVGEAGVREQRKRALPARVVVYLLLAMVLFFQSGYGEVWNKLVQGWSGPGSSGCGWRWGCSLARQRSRTPGSGWAGR